MKPFAKFLLVSILSFVPLFAFAQKEWDDVDISALSWTVSNKVNVYSNTTGKLDFWNYNAETKEDRKNRTWSYEKAEMGIRWEVDRAWKITFSIRNTNNDHGKLYKVYEYDSKGNMKDSWYNGSVYWGFIVNVNNQNGGVDSFRKYYADTKTMNAGHTYLETYDSYRRTWTPSSAPSYRYVQIIYDGKSTIKILAGAFGNDQVIHVFNNAKSINAITICAGVAAHVQVEGLKMQLASQFAHVVPYVKAGDQKYEKKDYWGAIEEYTKAVSAGYNDSELYYKRGSAYYNVEFYNNAIEDYTNSLNLKPTEKAYLYRGMCKLQKGDASCIEDLQRGGPKGAALAKEIGVAGGAPAQGVENTNQYVSQGTGVIIDSRGYVVTNAHVIDAVSVIDIFVTTHNGGTRQYAAKCIVKDQTNDLALLKIVDYAYTPLPPVPFGILQGIKDVGSSVFAMGYPKMSQLGAEIKVTDGIISSRTGYQGDVTTYQISAAIQPGSSGGPLFDSNGNLTGITSSGVQALQNVGYAIKTPYLRTLVEVAPESVSLPSGNQLAGLSLPEKIKRLSPYVVFIKVK